MKKTLKNISMAVCIAAIAMLFSGCWPFPSSEKIGEKIIEKTIESQTGGKVDVDADKKEMTINSDQGLATFSSEGAAKIPENFPKDIFIYSDAQVSLVMSGSSEKNYSVVYNTPASLEDAFLRYKEEMEKNGWKKESEVDLGNQGKTFGFKKENRYVGITMGTSQDSENSGKTTITITGGDSLQPPCGGSSGSPCGETTTNLE